MKRCYCTLVLGVDDAEKAVKRLCLGLATRCSASFRQLFGFISATYDENFSIFWLSLPLPLHAFLAKSLVNSCACVARVQILRKFCARVFFRYSNRWLLSCHGRRAQYTCKDQHGRHFTEGCLYCNRRCLWIRASDCSKTCTTWCKSGHSWSSFKWWRKSSEGTRWKLLFCTNWRKPRKHFFIILWTNKLIYTKSPR